MQQYVKELKILPKLDLSSFKRQINDMPKEVGKLSSDLRKPLENIQKNLTLKIDSKSLIEEIDYNLNKETFLKDTSFFKDFFKGFSKGLLTPEKRSKVNTEEEMSDLDKKIEYIKSAEELIKENIKNLKSQLSTVEGFDLYKEYEKNKEELKKNKEEIDSLYGDSSKDSQKRIKDLEKENRLLKNNIYAFEDVKDNFKELTKILNDIEDLDDQFKNLVKESEDTEKEKRDLKRDLNQKDGPDGEEVAETIQRKLFDKLENGLNSFINSFEKVLSDALDEFDEMSSYNLETSLRINSEAMDQALQYGLSSSQNYALSKTMEQMGARSEEDLMRMTPAQQERFAELIGKYSSKYQELVDKDLFSKYEEYQTAVEDFRENLKFEVIEFFADNKDTIIKVMDLLMEALSVLMDSVSWIVDKLTGDKNRTEKENANIVSDIINSYSVANNSTNNVKIDNNFSNIPLNNQVQYARAGQTVNEQLINALDGRLER